MKSIRTKIILMVCFLCILSLAISTGISYYMSANVLLKESKDKSIFIAGKYAENLNGWLEGQGKMIDEMVNDLEHYKNFDKDYLIDYFEAKQKPNPHIICFYMGYADKRFASGDRWEAPADYDCTTRDWYIQAVEKGGLVYTAPYLDATTNKMIITIAKPVKQDGTIVGVAGADIYVDALTKIVSEAKASKDSYAFLLDEDNNYIVHKNEAFMPTEESLTSLSAVMDGKLKPLAERIAKREEGIYEGLDYDGGSKYFVYSPIKANNWSVGFAIPTEEFRSALNSLYLGFGVALIVSLLLAVLLAVFTVNQIIKPILKLKESMNVLSSGDLTRKAEVRGKDETAQLANSFNQMVDDLKGIIANILGTYHSAKEDSQQLIENSKFVERMSVEISSATEHIAMEATELRNHISNGDRFLSDFSQKINSIVNSVDTINKHSDTAMQSVEKGLKNLDELKHIEAEIDAQSHKTGEIIDTFKSSAADINNMTSVISGIAEQTNMLALNAAIEAARAGEFGKGFAVVADEVRKLADESSKAASSIEALVQSIQAEAERFESVKVQSFELGSKMNQVGEFITSDFDTIHSNIQDTVKDVRQVYEQAAGISTDNQEMGNIMKNISNISEETAAATEEASASVENQVNLLNQMFAEINSLIGRIDELSKSVNKFSI